jgi:hypothetical protein
MKYHQVTFKRNRHHFQNRALGTESGYTGNENSKVGDISEIFQEFQKYFVLTDRISNDEEIKKRFILFEIFSNICIFGFIFMVLLSSFIQFEMKCVILCIPLCLAIAFQSIDNLVSIIKSLLHKRRNNDSSPGSSFMIYMKTFGAVGWTSLILSIYQVAAGWDGFMGENPPWYVVWSSSYLTVLMFMIYHYFYLKLLCDYNIKTELDKKKRDISHELSHPCVIFLAYIGPILLVGYSLIIFLRYEVPFPYNWMIYVGSSFFTFCSFLTFFLIEHFVVKELDSAAPYCLKGFDRWIMGLWISFLPWYFHLDNLIFKSVSFILGVLFIIFRIYRYIDCTPDYTYVECSVSDSESSADSDASQYGSSSEPNPLGTLKYKPNVVPGNLGDDTWNYSSLVTYKDTDNMIHDHHTGNSEHHHHHHTGNSGYHHHHHTGDSGHHDSGYSGHHDSGYSADFNND